MAVIEYDTNGNDHGDSGIGAIAQQRRKSPDGETTSNLICSTHVGLNEDMFPCVLDLHVPRGATVADVTYGKGIFWKRVSKDAYNVLATDIETGTDCRDLPYGDASIDCVVLDPPYMEGLYRRNTANMAGYGTYAAFRETYSDGRATDDDARWTIPRPSRNGKRVCVPVPVTWGNAFYSWNLSLLAWCTSTAVCKSLKVLYIGQLSRAQLAKATYAPNHIYGNHIC